MSNFSRSRGLDEIIAVKNVNDDYRIVRGKDKVKRAPRRMNMPVFPTFHRAEEANAYSEDGFVYALRTSLVDSGFFHGVFGLRYVKIPAKDPSLARHSYLAWVKENFDELEMCNRRILHMELCGTPHYQVHATVKRIKM